MKATELKSTFQPLGEEVGRLQYQNVDIRLLPYYRITLFPDENENLRVYDGYHRPNYNTGVISLIAQKDEAQVASMMKRYNELLRNPSQDAKRIFEMALLSIDIGWLEDGLSLMDSAIISELDQANYYLGRAMLRQRVLDELQAQHMEMLGELVDVVDTVFEAQIRAISDLAISDLQKVIALDPEMTFAHFNLGCIFSAIERYEDAERSFTKAIICKDDFTEAYYNRGLLRLLLGETREGCEDMSRAGELGMNDAYNVIKRYCE
jgi:tetratricopeptide (TPR) repeat protein